MVAASNLVTHRSRGGVAMTPDYRRGYVAGLEKAARMAEHRARLLASSERQWRKLCWRGKAADDESAKLEAQLMARDCRILAREAKGAKK